MKTLFGTIRKELNLYHRKPVTKNNLVQLDENKRLQFALAKINVSEETWKNTIFMDEKVFPTHKDGRLGVWRPPGAR